MPHEIAVRPLAERKLDGVYEERFAGPCLTGEHTEPAPWVQLGALNDGDVLHRDLDEHAESIRLDR